jgi:hypothetical protein
MDLARPGTASAWFPAECDARVTPLAQGALRHRLQDRIVESTSMRRFAPSTRSRNLVQRRAWNTSDTTNAGPPSPSDPRRRSHTNKSERFWPIAKSVCQ